MNPTHSLDYRQVRDEYLRMMNEQVELATSSTKCDAELVWDILGLASVTRRSIHASCDSLEDAPTGEGVLYQLRTGWLEQLELDELEDKLNALLAHNLPDRIRGRSLQRGGTSRSAVDVGADYPGVSQRNRTPVFVAGPKKSSQRREVLGKILSWSAFLAQYVATA